MKRIPESNLLISIVTVIILFFITLLFTMNEVTKRGHELEMKCANPKSSNTPICLKATHKN